MKIIMSVAIMSVAMVAGFAAVQTARAADLSIGPPVAERSRPEYRQAYVAGPVWRADRPADLLYTYAPEYPGWRGNSYYYYYNCGSVREILPDGTIVIRHRWAC